MRGGLSQEMDARQAEELRAFDQTILVELDQKVAEQQIILQQAGVPGFSPTTAPTEVRKQVNSLLTTTLCSLLSFTHTRHTYDSLRFCSS